MSGCEPDEVPFADGNVTGAARVGATVRRGTGSWTPAVHALLRHLEQAGFDAAPRVIGIDHRGREILSYVEGTTSADPCTSFATDDQLIDVARQLRLYHDATLAFPRRDDYRWRFLVGAPRTGDVICHNDIAPYNTVVADGRLAAFIDWDFAAPATRLWDIAHAVWRFVPLYDDEAFGTPAQQARRLSLFCNAYTLAARDELLATIAHRQQVLHDTVATWAAGGDPAFVIMWERGDAASTLADRAYLLRHWAEFGQALNGAR